MEEGGWQAVPSEMGGYWSKKQGGLCKGGWGQVGRLTRQALSSLGTHGGGLPRKRWGGSPSSKRGPIVALISKGSRVAAEKVGTASSRTSMHPEWPWSPRAAKSCRPKGLAAGLPDVAAIGSLK